MESRALNNRTVSYITRIFALFIFPALLSVLFHQPHHLNEHEENSCIICVIIQSVSTDIDLEEKSPILIQRLSADLYFEYSILISEVCISEQQCRAPPHFA